MTIRKIICMLLVIGVTHYATKAQVVKDSSEKAIDYSNKKQVDLTGLSSIYAQLKSSTIVVLNKKEILSIDSKKFKELTPESILSMDIIDDKSATTAIKTIIFIQTK